MIFKVFGGNDSAKTTTEPPPAISNDHGRLPPRIDNWPSNAWKNHHNDDASSSASDSTNSDIDQPLKPNDSSNKNFNVNNGFGFVSTQRPIYVNRDNHNNNINSNNNMSGGNNINKPTKKTSEYLLQNALEFPSDRIFSNYCLLSEKFFCITQRVEPTKLF